ncbi:hypothetical protein BAE46_00740 [Glaciecola punicea]|nr:hypothetical protein BAE46_00740 [Glaciecola punicea]
MFKKLPYAETVEDIEALLPWHVKENKILTTPRVVKRLLFNEYATYGSEYSANYIWKEYTTFGSKYSSHSPFNEYASIPPMMIKGGKVIGYLTANKSITSPISPNLLKALCEDEL